MLVNDWLVKRSQLTPHKTALVSADTGERVTYAELERRTGVLAAYLADKGIGKGDRVAILDNNSIFYLALLFALPRIGATLVPLNFRLSTAELEGIVQDASPGMLLCGKGWEETARQVSSSLDLPTEITGEVEKRIKEEESHFINGEHLEHIIPEDPWMILYTGGTTGTPKGAMLSYRMVTWNAVNTTVSWGLSPWDVVLMPMPFFHTGGLNVLTTPLLHLGGTVVIMSSFEPDNYLELLQKEKATIIFLVPTMFQMLSQNKVFDTADFSTVRFCISGGSPCPESIYRAYWERRLHFKQGYGLTEVGPNCFALDDERLQEKIGSVGRSVFHGRARLVDEQGEEAPPGGVGELVLTGPHVFSGYWNHPEATRQAFSGAWFHTGDLARCDEEGYFYIVDRKKDMFISGGENVYPVEIENVLYQHPAVAEAAVVGVPHEKWGEVGRAYLAFKEDRDATEEEILEFCRSRLASYKVPRELVIKESLPKSSAGKILKRNLTF